MDVCVCVCETVKKEGGSEIVQVEGRYISIIVHYLIFCLPQKWLAHLAANPRAPVGISAAAVGAKLTQVSILPFVLVDKWVPAEAWGR